MVLLILTVILIMIIILHVKMGKVHMILRETIAR